MRAGLIITLVAISAPRSWAQPADDGGGDSADKPWTKGVTPEQKEKAQGLLNEGNQLFLDAKYLEALGKYREALALYDHPQIRFNITRCLIKLDRKTEAFDNIEASLKYGKAPLGELFEEAKNYESLLQSQIAEVEIRCTQPGVAITVDGQAFASCPATRSIRLLPGNHQVVGRKPDFLTLTRDLVVLPGPQKPVEMNLVSIGDATVMKRRWKTWKPWAVIGGGLGVGGIGLLLELQARSTRSEYADILTSLCSDQPCAEGSVPDSSWQRAKLEHAIAMSIVGVGGAAIVTGIALVIMNRAHAVLPEQANEPKTQVVPTVSASGVGATLVHSF